jgi:hypothetical protein
LPLIFVFLVIFQEVNTNYHNLPFVGYHRLEESQCFLAKDFVVPLLVKTAKLSLIGAWEPAARPLPSIQTVCGAMLADQCGLVSVISLGTDAVWREFG